MPVFYFSQALSMFGYTLVSMAKSGSKPCLYTNDKFYSSRSKKTNSSEMEAGVLWPLFKVKFLQSDFCANILLYRWTSFYNDCCAKWLLPYMTFSNSAIFQAISLEIQARVLRPLIKVTFLKSTFSINKLFYRWVSLCHVFYPKWL